MKYGKGLHVGREDISPYNTYTYNDAGKEASKEWKLIRASNSNNNSRRRCHATTISSLVTAEENIKRNNDVKARSMLLMALPNEHLMTFNQYKDAKSLFAAI
uniref:Uncharacterized protein n=1 Tax=Tanacetum cinerariifolium TaxID=118510 RepID=A0A6L2NLR3_TANCI|nr:hypothetical protein [Tanacetum cinerariifolium]